MQALLMQPNVARNLKGHAATAVVHPPKYDSRPVARTVTTHVMDAN